MFVRPLSGWLIPLFLDRAPSFFASPIDVHVLEDVTKGYPNRRKRCRKHRVVEHFSLLSWAAPVCGVCLYSHVSNVQIVTCLVRLSTLNSVEVWNSQDAHKRSNTKRTERPRNWDYPFRLTLFLKRSLWTRLEPLQQRHVVTRSRSSCLSLERWTLISWR